MHKQYHLQDQPLGPDERIFDANVSIPGLHHRRQNALSFCRGRQQRLMLRPDPTNQHDPAAIAIYGRWKGWFLDKEKQLGFLPRDVAAQLKSSGLADAVRARLRKTYAGTDGYVEIELQIVGPASEYRRYRPLSDSPMDRVQAAREDGDENGQIAALMGWMDSTEAEASANGWGVAPRPYLDLAKLYRKLKRIDDEIAVLERFDRQEKAPGVVPGQLADRLEKARALRAKRLKR